MLRKLSFTEYATVRERKMQVAGTEGGEVSNEASTTAESTADDSMDTEEGWIL